MQSCASASQNPILRADALKYLTTFRSLIGKADAIAVFPHVVRALSSDSNVVHSYAAIAVERLLSMKVGV